MQLKVRNIPRHKKKRKEKEEIAERTKRPNEKGNNMFDLIISIRGPQSSMKKWNLVCSGEELI